MKLWSLHILVYSESGWCMKPAGAWRFTASSALCEEQGLILRVLMIIEGLPRQSLVCKGFYFQRYNLLESNRIVTLCDKCIFLEKCHSSFSSEQDGVSGHANTCEKTLFWGQRLGSTDFCVVILASVSFVKKASIRQC